MDILVLIMLALFLIIIALAVVIYIIVRRNSVDKKFGKTIEADVMDNLDDDDDDDFSNINVVMPSSFKETKTDDISEKYENDIKNDDNVNKEDIDKVENELEKEEMANVDVVIEPLVIEEKKVEKIEELINVLINKKNYIFLANNNVVSKNDHIKLILDGKVYFGIITKANYQKDISQFKVKPRKLIIIKNILKNEPEKRQLENSRQEEFLEFVPRKKEKM